MKYKYSTIQFIDSHSESIKDKNLYPIDGKPLWRYNYEMAEDARKKGLVQANFITTTYEKSLIDSKTQIFVPKTEFNNGKCKLHERVMDSISWINYKDKHNFSDAFILLLGNSRSFNKDLIENCIFRYETESSKRNVTGLITISNLSMYNSYRDLSISDDYTVKLVNNDNDCLGEEKDTSNSGWFFDGGLMIMKATNCLFKNVIEIHSTQFPYLWNNVIGFKQKTFSSIELDAAWQIPLMSKKYHDEIMEIQ